MSASGTKEPIAEGVFDVERLTPVRVMPWLDKQIPANISRKIVDSYWLDYNKKKIVILPSPSNQKHLILGLKTVSITLRRDQAAWLRSMAETTEKSISELGRSVLEHYFRSGMRNSPSLAMKIGPILSLQMAGFIRLGP